MFPFIDLNPDSVKEAAKASDLDQQQDTGDALPTLGLGSLWNVANAVTSVIKQTTDEVVRSVQETDWKNELAAFTHVVEAEAQKAVEVVQHLPQQVARTSESGSTPTANVSDGAEVGSPMMPFGAVGASLAEFGKQLISGTKEVLDTVTDMVEGELAMAAKEVPRFAAGGAASRTGSSSAAARLASRHRTSIKYSRFEAEVAAMQRDSATYCDEPEDAEDYGTWRGSWSMEQAQADIDKILTGNAFMAELQSRIVPLLVEKEDFWARYFYRLHRLQQKEEQRQQVAARAKQQLEEQEELGGWDDDDPQSPRQQDSRQQQQQLADGLSTDAVVPERGSPAHEAAAVAGTTDEAAEVQADQGTAAAAAEGSAAEAPAAKENSLQMATRSTSKAEVAAVDKSAVDTATEPPTSASSTAEAAPATAGEAITTSAAAAAGASVSHPRLCEDGSPPSTPVQIGSDISDAAPATETASDGSSATHGGAAHWTLVTDTAAAAATQQHSAPEQQKATSSVSPLRQSHESGVSQHTSSSSPQAAAPLDGAGGTSVLNAGAAAPEPVASASPALEHEEADDENWGDEDLGAAAASTVNSTADKQAVGKASRTAAAGQEEDEDWGNWD